MLMRQTGCSLGVEQMILDSGIGEHDGHEADSRSLPQLIVKVRDFILGQLAYPPRDTHGEGAGVRAVR